MNKSTVMKQRTNIYKLNANYTKGLQEHDGGLSTQLRHQLSVTQYSVIVKCFTHAKHEEISGYDGCDSKLGICSRRQVQTEGETDWMERKRWNAVEGNKAGGVEGTTTLLLTHPGSPLHLFLQHGSRFPQFSPFRPVVLPVSMKLSGLTREYHTEPGMNPMTNQGRLFKILISEQSFKIKVPATKWKADCETLSLFSDWHSDIWTLISHPQVMLRVLEGKNTSLSIVMCFYEVAWN